MASRPRFLPFLCAAAMIPIGLIGQQVSSDAFSQLRYRHIGPVGNRISSVAGVMEDPLTYYAGAASGGIWKTVDGGEYWEPVFDGYKDHAAGALAVAPSDPEIGW